MPFKSEAQRRFMYANDPEMAREFEAKTPPGKLPERVEKKQRGLADIIRGEKVPNPHPIKPLPKASGGVRG